MMKDISTASVKSLFRLDIRSRFGVTHKRGIRYRVVQYGNYAFFALVYAILVAAIYFLSETFAAQLGFEFLVLATTLTMCVATVVATGNVIKNLYLNGDNEMLLRFPVSGKEIYIAKSIYCILHNLIVCVLIMLPFYIMFGIVEEQGAGYYFAAIGVILLASFLPYFLANIIAVPAMLLMNLLKDKFLIVLILTVGAIVAAFILYMEALSSILNKIGESSNSDIFSPEMMESYRNFAANAYPFNFYAELLYGKRGAGLTPGDMGLRFLYILLITAAAGAIAYFTSTKAYYKIILYGIQGDKASMQKKNAKNTVRSTFGTLLNKEFFLIFRSFNYSFQYLAMAIAAPVMVYYCGALAMTLGTRNIGAQIVPGLTLMVIIIFVTIIVSFASTTVSREGNSFYHTKTMPVSYTFQIGVKFFLYWLVATASIILCCLVVGLAFGPVGMGERALLTSLDTGCIFAISEMFVVTLTSLSVWADIKSPTFNVAGDGELVAPNKNVALSMFVGIIIAVLFGLFIMLLTFLPIGIGSFELGGFEGRGNLYAVLAVISLIIMGSSLAALFARLEKAYMKIIP